MCFFLSFLIKLKNVKIIIGGKNRSESSLKALKSIINNKITKVLAVKDGLSSGGELCIKGRYGFDFANSLSSKRWEPHFQFGTTF